MQKEKTRLNREEQAKLLEVAGIMQLTYDLTRTDALDWMLDKIPNGKREMKTLRTKSVRMFEKLCMVTPYIMACSGIIDNSYCGNQDEWLFGAYATRETHICKGDRICQFRIMQNQPEIRFEKVDRLRLISRGGIGSTGVR